MRVAIVHDWLLGMRGGERCLEVLCQCFPDADLYTAFYQKDKVSRLISSHTVHVSALGRLPGVGRYYRHLLPLYPFAARSLSAQMKSNERAGDYDLVISVSHCLAKNVEVPRGAFHLCYCLTPMRYIWDQYDAYFDGRMVEPLVRGVVPGLQCWDVEGASRVDCFVGISDFVKERIKERYRRDASVVYPPVRSDFISPRSPSDPGEGFLCVNALVPYKNVEVVIEAFNRLPYQLTVVGSGPESGRLRALAGNNVNFLPWLTDRDLACLYRRSKALVFAAEEDFGMTPVEMQAAGRPVICYARGGALETVRADGERSTGVYFAELSPDAVIAAVLDFVSRQDQFTVDNCCAQARRFSLERFCEDLSRVLEDNGLEVPTWMAARSSQEQREQLLRVGS